MEVLLVIGIFVILAGFGLFVSMETYRGSNYHSDRALLIATLQRARAEAINNLCTGSGCTDGAPHGVHIQTDKYILFQGATYNAADTANVAFDADTNSTHSFSGDIVFSQLTGNVAAPVTITIAGGGRTSDITISTVGQISWTN